MIFPPVFSINPEKPMQPLLHRLPLQSFSQPLPYSYFTLYSVFCPAIIIIISLLRLTNFVIRSGESAPWERLARS